VTDEDRSAIHRSRSSVTAKRTLIPGGQRVTLSQGDEVIVTQSLGGSFTVQTGDGYLAADQHRRCRRAWPRATGDTEADKGRPRPARSISRR